MPVAGDAAKLGGHPNDYVRGNLTESTRLGRLGTFDSLAIRDYRLMWLAQIATSMGTWMDQVTRGWLIYDLTGSPLQLGITTATRGLPLLLFGVVAGAFADRSGRKMQLVVSQVTNALINLVLATLVLTGRVEPWHVYLTGFMAGTVEAFQQPARQTLVSDVVGDEKLMNALALNSAAFNASRALGPAVAGAFIAAVGVAGSYYLQTAMFLIATLWTVQMAIPERSAEHLLRAHEPFLQSIGTGLGYVARDRNIRTLMLLVLGPLIFGMSYSSFMPLIASDVLHGGAVLQGMLLSFIGIGSLVGALVVASMRRSHGSGLAVVAAALVFCVCVMAFASSHWVVVSLLIALALGYFSVAFGTQNQTLLQILAPRHLRGRVMSIYMLDRGLIPAGALLAGALASHMGGPSALRIMAVLAMLGVGLAIASAPSILTLKVPFQSAVRPDDEEEVEAALALEAAPSQVSAGHAAARVRSGAVDGEV